MAVAPGLALAIVACTGGGETPDADETTGGSGSTGAPPECTADADCGECMACEAGACVAVVDCGPAPECEADSDCGECQACNMGGCIDIPCEDTGDEACREGQWCEEGASFCAEGMCVDVPAPEVLAACDLPDIKPFPIEPQIQNAAVRWLDTDGGGAPPDIVAVAAGSLNAWIAPDWTLGKTALTHEGNAMDVLLGHPGPRVIEAGTAAQELAVHSVDTAGASTLLGSLDVGRDVLDVVSLDGDGDGVDEAVARLGDAVVHITIDADTLTEGVELHRGAVTDIAAVRTGGPGQLVAGREGGGSLVITIDDGGVPVATDGLLNPWGADVVVVYGGKYGLVGLGSDAGAALALSGAEPFATVAVPAGTVAAASYEGSSTAVILAGESSLMLVLIGEGGAECATTLEGGPFQDVAVADLGDGTLGIATIVGGEAFLYTIADVVD
ncbi:MAG: hypothetical protein AAF721_24940 [Myxococcota bacterium]